MDTILKLLDRDRVYADDEMYSDEALTNPVYRGCLSALQEVLPDGKRWSEAVTENQRQCGKCFVLFLDHDKYLAHFKEGYGCAGMNGSLYGRR